MKKLVFWMIIIALTASACEKQEMFSQLNGEWKITGISGSIAGSQTVNNFDVISFSQSGSYTVFFNDTPIQGGSYKIQQGMENEIFFWVNFNEKFNNDPLSNFYTQFGKRITLIGNESLTLSDMGITDGFNYHFARR
ncbi:MAG: hypothetical protein E4G94_03690 [ANME-2 cluster archaeon]|nr:MAG: hypothetical protein E4G94_03690 [ANME-2 cluster archaeon]